MDVKIDADDWRAANQELATLRTENKQLKEHNKLLAVKMGCLEPDENGNPSCNPLCICCQALQETNETKRYVCSLCADGPCTLLCEDAPGLPPVCPFDIGLESNWQEK